MKHIKRSDVVSIMYKKTHIISENSVDVQKFDLSNNVGIRNAIYLCNGSDSIDSCTNYLFNKLNEEAIDSNLISIKENILPYVSDDTLSNIKENYKSLSESIEEFEYVNRVINNINILDEQFKLSDKIRRTRFDMISEEDTIDFIKDITREIVSANKSLSPMQNMNIVAETLNIMLDRRVDEKTILESVATELLSEHAISEKDLMYVVNNINIFSEESKSDFMDSEPINELGITKPNSISKDCKLFQLTKDKNEKSVKEFTTKILSRSVDDCVAESDNILSVLTISILSLGATLVNPIMGLLTAFTLHLIKHNIDKSQCEKYLKNLKRTRKRIEKKMDKYPDKKDELKEFLEKIDSSIEKVENYKSSIQTDEENEKDWANESMDIVSIFSYVKCVEESLQNNDIDGMNILTEEFNPQDFISDIKRTSKLVKEKIANNARKLTDKERAISNDMDNRFNTFCNNFQRTFTLQKREQVIKGQVVPSLSNIFKMAIIAAGTAVTLGPVFAALELVATYAISKNSTNKERQYVLEEIEIQQKITEEKINNAKMKGDDKALEDLYHIKARLDREYKRIKYKMAMYR